MTLQDHDHGSRNAAPTDDDLAQMGFAFVDGEPVRTRRTFPCWTCESQGMQSCERHHPVVCVCDYPQPDSIGECRRCWRPYGERFTELRADWRTAIAHESQRLEQGGATAALASSPLRGRGRACTPNKRARAHLRLVKSK